MRSFSLFLFAVGAILTFAVTTFVEGVDLTVVGWILMGVGAVGFVASLITGYSRTRTTREVSADGRTMVEQRDSQV